MEEENKCINLLLEEWHKKNSDSKSEKIDKKILRDKIRVAPAVAHWSYEQWGHQLESLYLKNKGDLDKAYLEQDKSIMNELYFRIKARETSFEMASREFGEGPERRNGVYTFAGTRVNAIRPSSTSATDETGKSKSTITPWQKLLPS